MSVEILRIDEKSVYLTEANADTSGMFGWPRQENLLLVSVPFTRSSMLTDLDQSSRAYKAVPPDERRRYIA